MSNNIFSTLPGEQTSLYSILNTFIKDYLTNNVFTNELMIVKEVNADNTVNLQSILKNLDTQGNFLEDSNIINNVNVLTIKGGKTSISFNSAVNDIGLYLSFKKNFSNYFSNGDIKTTNKGLFAYSNGIFIPLTINNITSSLIIKNGSGEIEINDSTINITGGNITLNGNVNLGGSGGQGVARIGDSVQVNITSGSSAGTWTGTITSGSSTTKSL